MNVLYCLNRCQHMLLTNLNLELTSCTDRSNFGWYLMYYLEKKNLSLSFVRKAYIDCCIVHRCWGAVVQPKINRGEGVDGDILLDYVAGCW